MTFKVTTTTTPKPGDYDMITTTIRIGYKDQGFIVRYVWSNPDGFLDEAEHCFSTMSEVLIDIKNFENETGPWA